MFTPEQIKKNQDLAINLFSRAPMKETFQMSLSYSEQGAVFEMPFNQKFTHAFGSVHGGVLSTLIDNAGWFTAQPYYDRWINTIDLQVQFILPTSGETLFAKGELVKTGKQIAFTTMKVWNESNDLIAKGSGTFALSSQQIDLSKI
jgi:uncharacterized protein (TIGR00369 family)